MVAKVLDWNGITYTLALTRIDNSSGVPFHVASGRTNSFGWRVVIVCFSVIRNRRNRIIGLVVTAAFVEVA
jgi:hypothetical protein